MVSDGERCGGVGLSEGSFRTAQTTLYLKTKGICNTKWNTHNAIYKDTLPVIFADIKMRDCCMDGSYGCLSLKPTNKAIGSPFPQDGFVLLRF
jgi:hypothetical protein